MDEALAVRLRGAEQSMEEKPKITTEKARNDVEVLREG